MNRRIAPSHTGGGAPVFSVDVGGRRRGFTLIELLVVIAIIGILASLLLPVFARAKSSARRASCLNNLHQMEVAAFSYIGDNGDFFPIAYYQVITNGTNFSFAWDLTTITSGGTNLVIPGLLWEGQGNAQVQQCPSFTGSANWNTDPFTGYNYNTSYVGHGQYEAIPSPVKYSMLKHPYKTALFGDGEYSDGADKFMRAPWPNPGDATSPARWSGTQGFRHSGSSNVAYGDGHASSVKACYTNNADGAANVAPATGFLSSDNSAYDLE